MGKSNLYDSGTGLLKYRSRPGRECLHGKGKFDTLGGGGSHAVLFMIPLDLLGARSMAQVLWLPFKYYYY